MVIMIFKYVSEIDEKGHYSQSPSIPIVINDKSEFFALIDSGADISVMPKYFADMLGINLSTELEASYGIGGFVDSVQTKIKVKIFDEIENHEFEIPIKIVLNNNKFPILLGRKGFFDKFLICFNESQEQVSLIDNCVGLI